jgi:5'-nucleotidase
VDDDTNSIVEYGWRLIQIDSNIAEPDRALQDYIDSFKETVDSKYNTIVCKLGRKLTHPLREIETSLGNLIADAFADISECDVMLVGSGSIRVKELGPLVTLRDLRSCFPYDDSLNRFAIDGKKLKKIFSHIMRKDNRNGEGECYQVNTGIKAVYDDRAGKLASIEVNGEPVSESGLYTICMQGYHHNNCSSYLNISNEELVENKNHKVVSTSAQEVLEEYLKNNNNLTSQVKERLVYIG